MVTQQHLIYIGEFEELSPGRGYASIKQHMEAQPYSGQAYITQYLRNGKTDMVSMKIPKDVFTGEIIEKGQMLGMNDGVYMWWNTLAHYVERYNLRLPKDFEEHILQTVRNRAGEDNEMPVED